jgi:proteasome lid subunit RPN8/RPN11
MRPSKLLGFDMPKISQQVLDAVIAHARKDLPIEACGYLGERSGIITEAIPLKNVDASREHFTLDPEEQFTALRRLRSEGCKLKGVYHSHPSTPARPSAEDLMLASDPNLSYLIVSLAADEPVIKSFRIQERIATEEELTTEP